MRNRVVLLGVWMVLLGLAVQEAGAAEVHGRMVWEGPPPVPETIPVKPKAGQGPGSVKGCGHPEKLSPGLRVDPSGGVENVVVWVETAVPGKPAAAETVLLDQKTCEFFPHVLTLTPGKEVAIRNSDSVIHSVRVFREGRPGYLMNRWQKIDAADIRWKAETPGRYVVRCGVHLWMYAWVVVLPTESSVVSSASGKFRLSGLPSGKQGLHFWHEKVGEWQQMVEVGTGDLELGSIRLPAVAAKTAEK